MIGAVHSTVWLSISLGSGALAAASIMLLVPRNLRDPTLRGYRASNRQEAMGRSGLLRFFWPMVRLFAHYVSLLPLKNWREKQGLLIRHAGDPMGLSPDELGGLMISSSILGGVCLLAFAVLAQVGPALGAVGAMLGFFLPEIWLHERAQNRLRAINRGLPQALDLFVLGMGAGLDFIGAVRHVVEKWSDKDDPLYEEMSRFLNELNLGKTRKEALEDLAYRAPTELVKAFVSNAIQAEMRGTPLAEVLQIQANVARTQRFQTAEKVAGRAGVVILGPLMCIFVATLLVVFGGVIIKIARGQMF
jgi:tight adherence protein C